MADVQETVQSGEHVVEAKGKASVSEGEGIVPLLKSTTREWVFSMPDRNAAVAPGAKFPHDVRSSFSDKVPERLEEDEREPKEEKTSTKTLVKSWKLFYEGIAYTAILASFHHFVYPKRSGSTAFVACALFSVIGIRITHTTTNNVITKITYPAPEKMSPTDID